MMRSVYANQRALRWADFPGVEAHQGKSLRAVKVGEPEIDAQA